MKNSRRNSSPQFAIQIVIPRERRNKKKEKEEEEEEAAAAAAAAAWISGAQQPQ